MKHIFKKSIYIAVILLILGLSFLSYNYTANSLKSFVVGSLEKNFGARFSIAHMKMSFPLCLELKDVRIGDTITIAKVCLYPSPASAFFKKTFIFSNIKALEPVIRIKKGEHEVFKALFNFNNKSVRDPRGSKAAFYVSRIGIEKASIIYEDDRDQGVEFINLNADFKSPYVYIIAGRLLNFSVSGFIKNKDSGVLSPVRLNGWVKGDYTVKAKLRAQDVGIESLGPLYQKYLKQNVEKGSLDIDSKILVSKADLKADCFCKINDVILKGKVEKLSMPLIASFILGFGFKDNALKIDNLQTNLLSLFLNKS